MAACGYHFTAKTIGRSAGRSATAHAAYLTASKIENAQLGVTDDYTRKGGVEFVFHTAPKHAPAALRDIGAAWNAVEEVESRKNSTLALEYIAAFPHQLNAQQRRHLLTDFMREAFTRKNFVATGAVHAPHEGGDARNYHAHMMFSYRELTPDGWAKNKDREFASYATRDAALGALKEKWAELGARQLQRAGFAVEAQRWRHGHKTLPEQRQAALERGDAAYAQACAHEPTRHMGTSSTAMQRKGKKTERGAANAATLERNALRDELAALERRQQRLDRHLSKLEALELERMQRDANARDPAHEPRGTTQYAIDRLAEIAETQARSSPAPALSPEEQEAARRRAEEEALERALREAEQDQDYRLRR